MSHVNFITRSSSFIICFKKCFFSLHSCFMMFHIELLYTGPLRGGAGGQMLRGPATFRGPAGPTVNIVNL